MESIENQTKRHETKTAVRKNGITTRALFVKHFSMEDFTLLSRIKTQYNHKSLADALRWAVRRAANIL